MEGRRPRSSSFSSSSSSPLSHPPCLVLENDIFKTVVNKQCLADIQEELQSEFVGIASGGDWRVSLAPIPLPALFSLDSLDANLSPNRLQPPDQAEYAASSENHRVDMHALLDASNLGLKQRVMCFAKSKVPGRSNIPYETLVPISSTERGWTMQHILAMLCLGRVFDYASTWHVSRVYRCDGNEVFALCALETKKSCRHPPVWHGFFLYKYSSC